MPSYKLQRIPYQKAYRFAEQIVRELKPACDRIEIAGSLRRRKQTVGDIEIVCISKPALDLIGQEVGMQVEGRLANMVTRGMLKNPTLNGPRHKQFEIAGLKCMLDLYITTPDCWPVIFAIRTGPQDFSKRLVTQKSNGGMLPDHLKVRLGRVLDAVENKPLMLQDEQSLLELCGGWVDPEDRY